MSALSKDNNSNHRVAYRGHVISPVSKGTDCQFVDIRDGVVVVDSSGSIESVGAWSKEVSAERVVDFGKWLIMPGFVDMHLHLPQVTQTARSGEHLLKWLEKYIFPAESRFADPEHAGRISQWFFDELARNGTTCAVVFATIHKQATERAFQVAEASGLRVIMGKVMMDVNAPEELREDPVASLAESQELCERWHGRDSGRIAYAFTPRFAVTCSKELLTGTGRLWHENKGSFMHTHVAESRGEVELVAELFDDSRSYVDVYERTMGLKDRSILAHAIHLDGTDLDLLKEKDCSLAHCPSSNFFLKSGVFPFRRVEKHGIRFGLGSDVAGGPQMSMLQVMKDANYIQPQDWITPKQLLYRATLGGATALGLDEQTGSLETGKEADFVVIDPTARTGVADDMLDQETDEILSSLVFLGDDRVIQATFVRGRSVFSKDSERLVGQTTS